MALAQNDDPLARALATRPDPKNPIGPNMEVPLGWEVRLDQPKEGVKVGADSETSDIFFVTMTPGWHITTGPRAIFYHPASVASGSFAATAGVYLFPPGERNEAFGIFVGGRNLDSSEQEYVYFLIRRTGEFLIKRRNGESTEILHDWTRHEAVKPYTADTEGTLHNVLQVDAGDEAVSFLVNGDQVAQLPRSGLHVDGIVGLRVNHALNLHVDELSVQIRK